MNDHTPTPWEFCGDTINQCLPNHGEICCMEDTGRGTRSGGSYQSYWELSWPRGDADKKFLIRAVNSYVLLLSALERIAFLDERVGANGNCAEVAREALKAARGYSDE